MNFVNFLNFKFFEKIKKTPKKEWLNEVHYCKVIDVYDGDTVTVIIRKRREWIQIKVRMLGYDAPEIKPPKNKPDREVEIINAKKAKADLESQVLNKIFVLKVKSPDKYGGRILGELYRVNFFGKPEEKSINTWMMENSITLPYEGGTKLNFNFEN